MIEEARNDRYKRHAGKRVLFYSALLLLTLFFVSGIRHRTLSVPFERDEGEYAYAARLVLQGIPPFKEVYNLKMPGIYFAYAGIMALFGESVEAVHLGLILVTVCSSLLLFWLLCLLYGPLVGYVGALFLLILPLAPRIQGLPANAEHFVLLPALAGILMVMAGINRHRYALYACGAFLLGLALMTKQHAFGFFLFGLCYSIYELAVREEFSKRQKVSWGFLFIFSGMIPFGLTIAYVAYHHVGDRFWFWTLSYAWKYATAIPPVEGIAWFGRALTKFVIPAAPLLWIFSLLGLLCLPWFKTSPSGKYFAAGFLLASLAAISPGFHFRPHYFILLLPSAGLLAGICFEFMRERLGALCRGRIRHLPEVVVVCVIGAGVAQSLYLSRDALFFMTPVQIIRSTYRMNPFAESVEIGKFIEARSSAEDKIAVIGSEPQIYFYAKRKAATGFMYVYPLVENHEYALRMQKEMIAQIEEAMPKYMVFVHSLFSWQTSSQAPTLLFDWFQRFQEEYYDLVGMVDLISATETRYVWGDEAKSYQNRSQSWVSVLERKSAR